MKTTLIILVCGLCFVAGMLTLDALLITQRIPIVGETNYPYSNNLEVMTQIQRDIPNWNTLDSFNLSTELRKWSTLHTLHGGPDIATIYMPADWDGNLYQHLNVYANQEAGVWCSGYAHTYEEVLDLFGFESYTISVGDFPEYTHAAQLVRVNINGHNKFIIQDPYFEFYYIWNNGTPISWLEICGEMDAGRYDTFQRVETNVDDVRRNFHEVMNYIIFDSPKEELLGEGVPARGIWRFEYSITSNDGVWMSRETIRNHET